MQIVDIREIVAPQSKDGSNLFTIKNNEIECFDGNVLIPSTSMIGYPKFQAQFYDVRRPYQTNYSSYNKEVEQKIDSFILNNVYIAVKNDNDIKQLQLPQAYEEELFSCLNNNQQAITAAYNTLTIGEYYSGLILTGTTTSFEKLLLTCRFSGSIVHYQISDVVLTSYLDNTQSDEFLHLLNDRTREGKRIITLAGHISNIPTKEIISLVKFIFNSSFQEIL